MLAKKAFVRGLAAAAAQSQSASFVPVLETKVSRLPNGLTAASIDLNGAVSSLVVAYRAGSRYQQPHEAGVSHVLRNSFGKDSANYLGVKLLWQLGSVGGNLHSYASKDTVAVQLDVIRDNSPIAISLLGELGSPALKPWDVVESEHAIANDLSSVQPYDIVLELLYKSAYRNGSLSTPILAKPYKQHVNQHVLETFAQSRLISSEAVLFGVNVDHEDLLNYANQQSAIKEGKGASASESSYVGGGDNRVDGNTSVAHVIIAGEGSGLKDLKSVAVQEVLSNLIGSSASSKFTNSASGGADAVVAAKVEQALNQQPVGVNSVSIYHPDSSIIGVYIASDGQYADKAVHSAWQGLKTLANNGPSAEILEIAQKSAILKTLLNLEQPGQLALDQANNVLATGEITDVLELAKTIPKVTADDIKKAAKKIVDKPSIAAYGRINQVPYLDTL